jgi:hypothetical protein
VPGNAGAAFVLSLTAFAGVLNCCVFNSCALEPHAPASHITTAISGFFIHFPLPILPARIPASRASRVLNRIVGNKFFGKKCRPYTWADWRINYIALSLESENRTMQRLRQQSTNQ